VPVAEKSHDENVLRPVTNPFQSDGGLKMLTGNLGRSVIKISAVKPEHRLIEAPALIFHDQNDVLQAFKDGKLNRDFIAVVRFQGPRANGMPELHKLTPTLGVLQERGLKVALVTDGRMSGASGKVPAAIHVTPEANCGGIIGKIREGDMMRLDADAGTLELLVAADELDQREFAQADLSANDFGMGREMFATFRAVAGTADTGASSLYGVA
tara:strand:+ start:5953 stop:6588 length:636 start_codon:yes stop_codon:yes gene_type:complete